MGPLKASLAWLALLLFGSRRAPASPLGLVDNDLSPFTSGIACGLPGVRMTSLR